MVGTILSDLSLFLSTGSRLSDCDVITDWAPTVTADIENLIQGTGSNSIKVSSTTSYPVMTLRNVIDLTNINLYAWVAGMKVGQWDTYANGGIGLRVDDVLGNFAIWYVAGSNTLPHSGWICHTVRTNQSIDSGSTPTAVDLTRIKKVGFRFKVVVAASKINVWFDAYRYGQGVITIKSGSIASPATFDDIYTYGENYYDGSYYTNKWGIVDKNQGVYFVQGKLQFGDTAINNETYFEDTSQLIVFRDSRVGSPYYNISIVGNTTSGSRIYFGTSGSGGSGFQGMYIKSAGVSKYKLTADNAYITDLGLFGCSFYDADTISLPTGSSTRNVFNSSFEASAEILASTCNVMNCSFISSDGRGVRMSGSYQITDSSFINCITGSHINATGSYNFNDLTFSGNLADVENSSDGEVIIYNIGSNASTVSNTGGGTTQIITSASHILTGMIQNTEVTYIDVATEEVLFNVENVDETGETEYPYDATVEKTVDIHIHHVNYVPILIPNIVLTSAGGSIPITQFLDRVYNNP